MHYQNDTFLFLLQEVSLKYHKSSMKYHKSSMKYHKNSLLTILPRYRPELWALNARSYGQQMPNTWAIDAHHVGSECPPNGHRQTN